MKQPTCSAILILLLVQFSDGLAQSGESPIRIFGYFQNSLQHWTEFDTESTHPQFSNPADQSVRNSFSLQQLNLFFSKNLSRRWRAFVNFEVLNNFSSQRQWGAFNLEEAWVRYKESDKFNLKMGLLIPIFNHLNEIKNRTPLLPYIIRPIFYETSFSELFDDFEEFVPNRAFLQASGVLPAGQAKLDYALYVGNSPNINNQSSVGQTGVDTTSTFLVGGRTGVRFKDLKIGFSATRENVNLQSADYSFNDVSGFLVEFHEVPRVRLGGDLSFHLGELSFEGELVKISYDNDRPEISIDKGFYYGTLGYPITERFFTYASYWFVDADFPFIAAVEPSLVIHTGSTKIKVRTMGATFNINDRITLKGQFTSVAAQNDLPLVGGRVTIVEKQRFKIFSLATSVFF